MIAVNGLGTVQPSSALTRSGLSSVLQCHNVAQKCDLPQSVDPQRTSQACISIPAVTGSSLVLTRSNTRAKNAPSSESHDANQSRLRSASSSEFSVLP